MLYCSFTDTFLTFANNFVEQASCTIASERGKFRLQQLMDVIALKFPDEKESMQDTLRRSWETFVVK